MANYCPDLFTSRMNTSVSFSLWMVLRLMLIKSRPVSPVKVVFSHLVKQQKTLGLAYPFTLSTILNGRGNCGCQLKRNFLTRYIKLPKIRREKQFPISLFQHFHF